MRRHPLLWKLALLQVSFCLLLIWLIWTWGLSVERSTYFLSQADQDYLARYAQQAEQAWEQDGAAGTEAWRKQVALAEDTWVAVIGPHLQSLGITPLSAEEASHLTFMRKLDWPNACQVLFFFLGRHPVKWAALISERRILQIAFFAASATHQNGANSKIVIFGQSWCSL